MKQLIILICLPLFGISQNTIGLPDVINYSKQAYNAGLQNWDIKQDKNGIIYIANNEGLLSFDGRSWNLYPLPNKTIVRSVEIGSDNRIYAGGQDEFGYFTPDKNGHLRYQSLCPLFSAKDKSFGDVWDIIFYRKDIFFRTSNNIFKISNNTVETYKAPSEWSYLSLCNGRLLAHDHQMGIMHFENGIWRPLAEKNELPLNDPVTALLPLENDSTLITTLKNGLFMLFKKVITRLPSENNPIFEHNRIYAATKINGERFALATNNNGVFIIDPKGNIIQSFSKTEGLQNNNVLSIFCDNQSNLWLGLDNGIDLVAYNSAIKQINPSLKDGSGYTAIVYKNRLYTGTTNGLYSVALQQMNDLSFSKGDFKPVNNTNGQNWVLAQINDRLLLGHHEGAFEIRNNTAEQISANPGFWNFVPLSATFPARKIIAGNYKGLSLFDDFNGRFIESGLVNDFNESSRFVSIDKDENIWVSHPYHGVFRIYKNKDGSYASNIYSDKNGLPSILNNHIYKIKNEVVVATEKGVFHYNPSKDIFEPSAYFRNLFGEQSIRYLKEDQKGNIWFIREKMLGVADLSGKEPVVIHFPELNNKLLSGFEFIYPINENNILLAGEKGFYHINYEKYKNNIPALQVNIRTVRIIDQTDSLLFAGYFNEVNENQIQHPDLIPNISNSWKTIHFEFSAPEFASQSNLEFSYRLVGFDENWSTWTKRTEKEYTNLPTGNFQFETKARNNLGNESAIAVYSFNMLPPWYESNWVKISYILLFMLFLYWIYNFQQRKFRQQKLKFEEEQKRLSYIHELEINKTESELITIKNEKLEAEINFKNSELASTAMHLVKKGELLNKSKNELTQLMKGLDNSQAISEIKKMIKILGEDENSDKEWEKFTIHFDKVHSDFLSLLKDKYPSISPNELKLSAYLRMNLSTKEIAQLMNISTRGVEISRYRLRKKLQMPKEVNLFDFLIRLEIENK